MPPLKKQVGRLYKRFWLWNQTISTAYLHCWSQPVKLASPTTNHAVSNFIDLDFCIGLDYGTSFAKTYVFLWAKTCVHFSKNTIRLPPIFQAWHSCFCITNKKLHMTENPTSLRETIANHMFLAMRFLQEVGWGHFQGLPRLNVRAPPNCVPLGAFGHLA
jgi:hypothetical protein